MRVPLPGPVWAIICLFVATSLAGCHGLELTDGNTTASTNTDGQEADDTQVDPPPPGDNTQDDTNQGTPPPPPPADEGEQAPPEFTFTLTGAPGQIVANETFNVTVQVSGDAGQATSAGIAYGTTSTASVDDADLTTDMFDATVAGDPATLTLPGTYQVKNWSLPTPGTVYFRAQVVVDGASHWSNEFSITVEAPPAVEEVTGTADHTVDMPAPLIPGDFSFDPETLTIAVGETVQWTNSDSTPHTTTSSADPPLWDSGNMNNGATSPVYRFNAAGTYAYKCAYHTSMTGSIVVE